MKKCLLILLFSFSAVVFNAAHAQCSVCTRTAQQLGEKPAKGLNSGIIYLMLTPFLIGGYIGYRWWRSEKGS